jgi:hypothetical protein
VCHYKGLKTTTSARVFSFKKILNISLHPKNLGYEYFTESYPEKHQFQGTQVLSQTHDKPP